MDRGSVYCERQEKRKAKLQQIMLSDYLETVMLDVGFEPRLKRFERITQCVRIMAQAMCENVHLTATKLFETLSRETGEADRWINKQIGLALKAAYKNGRIRKLNDYARYRLIESDVPIGNYLLICELTRILFLKAVDTLNAEKK